MYQHVIKYYALVLCFCFACSAYALDLRLDEHISHSQLAEPVASKPVTELEQGSMVKHTSALRQLWWLLPVCAFFLLFGWLFRYWQDRRSEKAHARVEVQPASLDDMEVAAVRAAEIRTAVQSSQQVKSRSSKKRRVRDTEPDPQFDHAELKKVYIYHRLGKKQEVMDIMNLAFRHDPFDFSIYDISMRILAESDEELPELQRLFQTGLFLLRSKRPMLWKEVAVKGRALLPDLEDWSWEPS